MQYHVVAEARRCSLSTTSIVGNIYLISDTAINLGDQDCAHPINVGVRGLSKGAEVLFDERMRVSHRTLVRGRQTNLICDIATDLISKADSLEVSLVMEGSHWIEGSPRMRHLVKRRQERDGTYYLVPSIRYNKSFFEGGAEAKLGYAIAYLNELQDKLGDAIAVEFAWQYFLGRRPDRGGKNDRLKELGARSSTIGEVAQGLYNSIECKERLHQRPLADPYLSLGVWSESR